MQGEQQAILRVPAIANHPICAPQQTNWTAASSGYVAIPGNDQGCWVTFKPIGAAQTDHVRIRFGTSSVAPADASDETFFSNVTEDYWVPPGVTGMRIIGRAGSSGTLEWHRSSY